MKIAIIGQSAFGVDVYKALRKNGHEIVVVFTIPDKNGREDLLGEECFLLFRDTSYISYAPSLIEFLLSFSL